MTFVCRIAELPPGEARVVSVEGVAVAVFYSEGKYAAVEELCPHRAGPLSEGKLTGHVVQCPWHGAQFDIHTGEVLGGPAARSLKTYRVILLNDDIFVSR